MQTRFKALVASALLCLTPVTFAGSIVDELIAINDVGGAYEGEFDSLITAVIEADLVDTLATIGSATVFAPDDAAFEALGLTPFVIELLPPQLLSAILLYHVVPETLFAQDLTAKRVTPLTMANSGDALVTNFRSVKINRANVTAVDIQADNGVIHVIDGVLIPVLSIQPR